MLLRVAYSASATTLLAVLHLHVALANQDSALHTFMLTGDTSSTKVPHSGKPVDYGKFGLTDPKTNHQLLQASTVAAASTKATFRQLVDHDQGNGAEFDQRYWVNDAHFEPGGPIILLIGGEVDASGRLPTLENGIGDIVARAVNGKAVLLETRYYGESIPTADFSTKNLKYLNVDQSVRDAVYFRQTAWKALGVNADTPWVVWGASYGGLLAALTRKRFPEQFVGAIASSAMIHRTVDFPQYWDSIMSFMPSLCRDAVVNAVAYFEDLCSAHGGGSSSSECAKLKSDFLMDSLTDIDFLQSLTFPLSFWQLQRWDQPSDLFRSFCQTITSGVTRSGANNSSSRAQNEITALDSDGVKKVVSNWAEYSAQYLTLEYCFGTIAYCFASYQNYNGSNPARDDFSLSASFRPFLYQQCTELGLMRTAESSSQYASLIPRRLDHDYYYAQCQAVFHDMPTAIPARPNIDAVNKFGGVDLVATNLAFIDGAKDAWLQSTAHAALLDHELRDRATAARNDSSTMFKTTNHTATTSKSPGSKTPSSEWTYKGPKTWRTFDIPANGAASGRHVDSDSSPFKIMPDAVHHWDEYGLPGDGGKGVGGKDDASVTTVGDDVPVSTSPPPKTDLTAGGRVPAEVARVQQTLVAAVKLWTAASRNATTTPTDSTGSAPVGGGGTNLTKSMHDRGRGGAKNGTKLGH